MPGFSPGSKKLTFLFFIFLIILIAQRFFHFGSVIEEPFAWRQFDTEFYAYDFFTHGINLLRPGVCWMGGFRTLALEFPLISVIISVLYSIFGDSLFYARLVIVLFSLGSAYYLNRIVKRLFYARLANITTLIYLMAPMSLYYSRALFIDIPTLFFAFGMFYYYLIGFEKSSYWAIIIGSGMGTIAFLIKAPYVFFLYIPLLYFILKEKKIKFLLKALPILAIPVLAFIIWQVYTVRLNASAPDWSFIPDYFKFTNMDSWYFGDLPQRLNFENWKTLFFRFVESCTGYIGIIFFISGLFLKTDGETRKNIFGFYGLGTIIYLLIFFSLNIIHDYYQIPLLVISSFFIAVSIDYIYRKLSAKGGNKGTVVTAILLAALIINCIWFTERWYYKPDWTRQHAAEIIEQNTGQNSLVIASITDTDPRDPRLLGPAHRYGWSIRTGDLSVSLVNSLKQNGAEYLAIVEKEKINDELLKYLAAYPSKEYPLQNSSSKLILYSIK